MSTLVEIYNNGPDKKTKITVKLMHTTDEGERVQTEKELSESECEEFFLQPNTHIVIQEIQE